MGLLQRNRPIDHIASRVYTAGEIYDRNWLHNYGGWEVPPSAVCKLETQESWGCDLVQVQRSKNWGTDSVSPSLSPRAPKPGAPKSQNQELRIQEMSDPAQAESKLTFSFDLRGPPKDWIVPTPLAGATLFSQAVDPNTCLFCRHPHGHTQR